MVRSKLRDLVEQFSIEELGQAFKQKEKMAALEKKRDDLQQQLDEVKEQIESALKEVGASVKQAVKPGPAKKTRGRKKGTGKKKSTAKKTVVQKAATKSNDTQQPPAKKAAAKKSAGKKQAGAKRGHRPGSLPAAIHTVLSDAGKPMSIQEVAAEIEKRKLSKTKNLKKMVGITLSQNNHFKRVKKGVYTIK